jgi:hypothetical protein
MLESLVLTRHGMPVSDSGGDVDVGFLVLLFHNSAQDCRRVSPASSPLQLRTHLFSTAGQVRIGLVSVYQYQSR